ncbi:MAG: hypothetical protein V1495_08850 [Pseudomonadota bacterium]
MKRHAALILALFVSVPGFAQTPTPTPGPEHPDFEACFRKCTETRCPRLSASQSCEAVCSSNCSLGGIILGPHSDRQSSLPGAKTDAGSSRPSSDDSDVDPLALVAVAVLMVTPMFYYAVDRPPSESQEDAFGRFKLSIQGGLGAALPGNALFRAGGTARYAFGWLGFDWIGTRGGDDRFNRASLIAGVSLPPKRHIEMAVVGGPMWEWGSGSQSLGGFFGLPSRFLLPSDFQIRIDPRIGRVSNRTTADLGGHFGIPLGRRTQALIGGQVLFRGKDASGGPQLLIETNPWN